MARARMRVAVKEVDRGWAALRKTIQTLKDKDSYVKVGVLDDGGKGSQKRKGGISTAELAAVQEFGTRDGHIPARPFVGSTFDANKAMYVEDLKVLVKGIYEQKMTVERALGIMGAKMAADIKKTVTVGAGVPPPNADSTLLRKLAKGAWKAKKGKARESKDGGPSIEVTGEMSVRTLIDSARMVGAVTWAVILSSVKGKS